MESVLQLYHEVAPKTLTCKAIIQCQVKTDHSILRAHVASAGAHLQLSEDYTP